MKNKKNQFSLIELLVVLAVIAILAVMLLPAMAQSTPYSLAPQQPNFYRQDTTEFPLTLANAGAAAWSFGATNSLKLTVRQDHGLSLFVRVASTNSTSSGVVAGFDVSPDGTNGTTTEPLQWTLPTGYIGTNVYWTNLSPDYLNNVRAIQLTTLTNKAVGSGNTNSVQILNFWYSYSGQ